MKSQLRLIHALDQMYRNSFPPLFFHPTRLSISLFFSATKQGHTRKTYTKKHTNEVSSVKQNSITNSKLKIEQTKSFITLKIQKQTIKTS